VTASLTSTGSSKMMCMRVTSKKVGFDKGLDGAVDYTTCTRTRSSSCLLFINFTPFAQAVKRCLKALASA
jgi:hypothetical protein